MDKGRVRDIPAMSESTSIGSNCVSDISTSAYRRAHARIRMFEPPVVECPHIIVIIPAFGRCRCGVDRSQPS
jgi:hypothetical protein